MNTIIKKVVVAICVAMGVAASAIAGEIVDIVEAVRNSGGVPTITATSQSGDAIFDGDISTFWRGWKVIWNSSTQAQINEHETITYILPEDWNADKNIYLTSYSISTEGAGAGIKAFKFYASTTGNDDWVLLDSQDVSLPSSQKKFATFHISPDATTRVHSSYRAFRLEIYDSCSLNYAGVSEMKINAVVADTPDEIPYRSFDVQVIPSQGESFITTGIGKFAALPTDAPSYTSVATGSFNEGEFLTWILEGYALETSTDNGQTWSEPITNLNVASYVFTATAGVDERLTWIYKSRARLPDEIFVDPTSGDDENIGTQNAPFKSLETVVSIISSDKTIRLLPGTYVISETMDLRNLENVAFVGADADTTIIIPAENVQNRLLQIENVKNISFSNVTFKDAHYARNEADLMGGAIFAKDTTSLSFTNCKFINNTVENLADSLKSFGGAIATYNSFITINDCYFEGNTSKTKYQTAFGGAVSVVTTSNLGGGIACTNSVFTSNIALANYNSILAAMGGALFIGSATQNEFNNCLFSYNDCNSGSSGFGEGTIAVSGNGGIFDGSNINGTTLLQNCTFANNTTDCAIRSTQGTITANRCLFYGHRSLTTSSVGQGTSFNECFYDMHHPGRVNAKITWNNCVKGDAQLLPDLTVPLTSPAAGYGRIIEPMDFVAKTWYVNPAIATSGDGNTLETAFASLTEALAVARDGDTIQLAAGRYTPQKESFPIDLTNRKFITIQGAGSGETIFEPEGEEDRVIVGIMNLKQCYSSTIKGFSIRGFETSNRQDGTNVRNAGLAINVKQGSRILLRDIIVEGCLCKNNGSWVQYHGVLFNISRVMQFQMDHCKIRNNVSRFNNNCGHFGFLRLLTGFGVISNCEFTDNRVAANWCIYGFAINISSGNPNYVKWELNNCLIANNIIDPDASFTSSTISQDAIYSSPGAVSTSPNIYNCTIIGGVNNPFCDGLFARNCIFVNCGKVSNNKANLFDCVIVTNEAFAAGNFALSTSSVTLHGISHGVPRNVILTDDVKFRNPEKGKYTLLRGSPAIDIGSYLYFADTTTEDPEALGWLGNNALDIAGNPRLIGKALDAGCYEAPKALGFNVIVR